MKTLADWLALDEQIIEEEIDGVVHRDVVSRWDFEMHLAWSRGARKFGKIAGSVAQITDDGEIVGQSNPVGTVRSLLDPEDPPEGTEFYLAWHDGARWHYGIPIMEQPRRHDNGARRAEVRKKARLALQEKKRLEVIGLLQRALGVSSASEEQLLLALCGQSDEMTLRPSAALRGLCSAKEAANEGDLLHALSLAFEAGMAFGREDALDQMAPILDLHRDRDRTSEWVQVACDALQRHGGDLTPLQLLRRMGGNQLIKKGITYWSFPSGAVIDQKEFQEAVKAAKKRIGSGSH